MNFLNVAYTNHIDIFRRLLKVSLGITGLSLAALTRGSSNACCSTYSYESGGL